MNNPAQIPGPAGAAQAQLHDELVGRIACAVPADGSAEPLSGLHLHRASAPTGLNHGILKPAFCIVAQGAKEVLLGDQRFQYDPAHYLLVTVELPIVSHVIEASWAQPYFSLRLDLDLAAVGAVMVEAPPLRPAKATKARAMAVSALDGTLLDAVVRLLRLLDTPRDAAFLAPLIQREIVYRLLVGEQGDLLRQIAVEGGETYRIARALARLRTEYDRPLRVEELAGEANMSASGFYHHFKAITGMSPLQYQKQHRLQEARRLLLGEHLDATTAAYRVGYDDVSQFNREYKRLFGSPPMRDMGRLRAVAQQGAALAAD